MSFKTTVREWFRKDDRPDEDQFNNWFNWTRWNDEKIPLADIEEIEEILNDKADREAFETHLTDADAHAELFAEPNARLAVLESKTDSDNNFTVITGYTLDPITRVLTMDAGWVGTINGIEHTNVAAQELDPAIPLAAAGYSRIDLIVFDTDANFERIAGVESLFTPVAPPKPLNTLEATFLTVGDGYVNAPVIPKPKAPVTSVNGMRGDVVLPTAPKATDAISGLVKTDTTVADPVVYTTETADNLLKAKVNAILEIKPITGIAYTLIAYDTENLVQLAYDGTLPMTVTIPNDATLNLPVGSIFYTVGSNTGALTIAGGAGVTFQTAVGLTAGQNETRKYVKKAANTWQVEGGAQPMAVGGAKIYKTYFVNTSTGNNTTGAYEDSTKPFASIDYVASLPAFAENDIIYLQNKDGVFPLNGVLPAKSLTIKSDEIVTLDFSANNNTNFYYCERKLTINLPNGKVWNNRGGGTGAKMATPNSELYLYLKANEVYFNTSTVFFDGTYMELYINKLTLKSKFATAYAGMPYQPRFDLVELVCLGTDVVLFSMSMNLVKKVTIGTISGAGNMACGNSSPYFEIGNISSTGNFRAAGTVKFMDSVITTPTGIDFFNTTAIITGRIASSPIIKQSSSDNYWMTVQYVEFHADLKAGQLITGLNNTIVVVNSEIKSNTTPFKLSNTNGAYGYPHIIARNSVFEIVTPAALVTGGAGNVSTVKIAGISTNATVLSDQSGTGVTVTQMPNY